MDPDDSAVYTALDREISSFEQQTDTSSDSMDGVHSFLETVIELRELVKTCWDQIDPRQFDELNDRLDAVAQKLEKERASVIQKMLRLLKKR